MFLLHYLLYSDTLQKRRDTSGNLDRFLFCFNALTRSPTTTTAAFRLGFSLPLLSQTYTDTHSLSLSLSHTHTRSFSRPLTYSLSLVLTLSFSISLSSTYTLSLTRSRFSTLLTRSSSSLPRVFLRKCLVLSNSHFSHPPQTQNSTPSTRYLADGYFFAIWGLVRFGSRTGSGSFLASLPLVLFRATL